MSFYFPPDLCAGSFRCGALVKELQTISGVDIEIVTTQPNRYDSFSENVVQFEESLGVKIHRIPLPSHKSGMWGQIKAFFQFYFEAKKIVKSESYDIVFATSSRLFTGFLGARIANAKKIPLYLDIRDIFVDTIDNILSRKVNIFIKPLLSIIERYTFKSAQRINLVSKGFESYFNKKYSNIDYRWYTNGIDDEFLNTKPNLQSENSNNVLKIVYAGNIGEGQGLHTIIPEFAKSIEGKFEIIIIGDGGKKSDLEEKISQIGCKNVALKLPLDRKQLVNIYMDADILFLHLNDYPAFEKVLPSKIFEYAALGKPILAGVSGYAAEFILSEVNNAEVFYPGCSDKAVTALNNLDFSYSNRDEFIVKYSRHNIMTKMAEDIHGFAKKIVEKK